MQAVSFPERQTLAGQTRTHYRHALRTLTYVTLDQANGGIIRNLNHEGVAVQAVAPLHEQQRVRLRFELRFPRLRVDTYGEVSWASSSGQCGIRFVDLPARTAYQINEWIFSNLLEAIDRDASHPRPIFGPSVVSIVREESGREGNVWEETIGEERRIEAMGSLSPPHRARRSGSIQDSKIEMKRQSRLQHREEDVPDRNQRSSGAIDLAFSAAVGRALWRDWWIVSVMIAGLLLFALIFLSIAHELPPWPLALGCGVVGRSFRRREPIGVYSRSLEEQAWALGWRRSASSPGERDEDE